MKRHSCKSSFCKVVYCFRSHLKEEEYILEVSKLIEKRKRQIVIVSSITSLLFVGCQYTSEKEV